MGVITVIRDFETGELKQIINGSVTNKDQVKQRFNIVEYASFSVFKEAMVAANIDWEATHEMLIIKRSE